MSDSQVNLEKLESILADQRRCWQAGKGRLVEDYLIECPELASSDAVVDLIYHEFCLRRELGESLTHAEILARFPQHGDELERLFEVDAAFDFAPLDGSQAASHGTVDDEGVLRTVPFDSTGSASIRPGEAGELAAASQRVGRFELLERIGGGAFGEVWRARDSDLNRLVAVKFPRAEVMHAEGLERFLREGRAAACLKHPNIVPIYEVGRIDERAFIVSEFITGQSLDRWLDGKPLACRRAAELCEQIARAVHHAHSGGVIHRDIKPSNIVLDHDAKPYVTDFGLAKQVDGLVTDTATIDGQILGTPAYMSPEQADGRGHDADARSDIYSLGVVLYEMLTAERPFRGNLQMLLQQVITSDPPSPRTLVHTIDRDLETICLKCLEKVPQNRYSSALELAEELARYLRNEPILARPVSVITRLTRWMRRHPRESLTMAFVTGLVLLTIGVSSWYSGRLASAEREATFRDQALQWSRSNAEIQEYHACLGRVRDRATRKIPGWTWDSQADLSNAATLAADDQQRHEVRSQLAFHQQAFDLRPIGPLATKLDVFSMAFSHDGTKFAVASNRAYVDSVPLEIVDVDSQRSLHKLSFAARLDVQLMRKLSDLFRREQVDPLRSDGVRSLVFHPSEPYLFAGSRAGYLYAWNIESGQLVRSDYVHDGAVLSIQFEPSQQALFTASEDRWVKRWSWPEMKLQASYQHESSVRSLALWNSQWMVVGDTAKLISVDRLTAVEGAGFNVGFREALSLPSVSELLVGDGTQLLGLDAVTHAPTWTIRPAAQRDLHDAPLRTMSVNATHRWVATSDSEVVRFWDLLNGTLQQELHVGGHSRVGVLFHPLRPLCAIAGNDGAMLYELANHAACSTSIPRLGPVTAFALDEEQSTTTLAYERARGTSGTDSLFHIATVGGASQQMVAVPHHRSAAITSLKPNQFVSLDRSELELVECHLEGENVTQRKHEVAASMVRIAKGPSDRELTFIGELPFGKQKMPGLGICSLDETTTRQLVVASLDQLMGRGGEMLDLTCPRSIVAASSLNGNIYIGNHSTSEAPRTLCRLSEIPEAIAMDDRHARLFVGTRQGTLTMRSLETGQPLSQDLSIHERITSVSIDAHGICAVGTQKGNVHLFQFRDRFVRLFELPGEGRAVRQVALDGSRNLLHIWFDGESGVRRYHLDRLVDQFESLHIAN